MNPVRMLLPIPADRYPYLLAVMRQPLPACWLTRGLIPVAGHGTQVTAQQVAANGVSHVAFVIRFLDRARSMWVSLPFHQNPGRYSARIPRLPAHPARPEASGHGLQRPAAIHSCAAPAPAEGCVRRPRIESRERSRSGVMAVRQQRIAGAARSRSLHSRNGKRVTANRYEWLETGQLKSGAPHNSRMFPARGREKIQERCGAAKYNIKLRARMFSTCFSPRADS